LLCGSFLYKLDECNIEKKEKKEGSPRSPLAQPSCSPFPFPWPTQPRQRPTRQPNARMRACPSALGQLPAQPFPQPPSSTREFLSSRQGDASSHGGAGTPARQHIGRSRGSPGSAGLLGAAPGTGGAGVGPTRAWEQRGGLGPSGSARAQLPGARARRRRHGRGGPILGAGLVPDAGTTARGTGPGSVCRHAPAQAPPGGRTANGKRGAAAGRSASEPARPRPRRRPSSPRWSHRSPVSSRPSSLLPFHFLLLPRRGTHGGPPRPAPAEPSLARQCSARQPRRPSVARRTVSASPPSPQRPALAAAAPARRGLLPSTAASRSTLADPSGARVASNAKPP
jgi:hypothetical protein